MSQLPHGGCLHVSHLCYTSRRVNPGLFWLTNQTNNCRLVIGHSFVIRDSSFLIRNSHCFSYSPLLTRFKTVNPAFLASEIESAFGELNVDHTFRTGFLHAGHWVRGAAETGRRRVNFPPQTLQSPSQSSYSYNGISYFFTNGPNKSIGTGRKVVVLCSLEISRIVCRNRSCRAIGSLLIIAAACTIFSAA